MRRLWWRDFDGYGHLTAGAYGVLYHDVVADFVMETWGTTGADYVAAQMSVEHLHEIRPDQSPVRVYVGISRIGTSSFRAGMVLTDVAGEVCSTAQATYVAWDRNGRRPRELTGAERVALDEHAGDPLGIAGGSATRP